MKYLGEGVELVDELHKALIYPYSQHVLDVLEEYRKGKPSWFRFEVCPHVAQFKPRDETEGGREEQIIVFKVNCMRTAAILCGYMGGYMQGVRAFALGFDKQLLEGTRLFNFVSVSSMKGNGREQNEHNKVEGENNADR